jgi:hypothetical protein
MTNREKLTNRPLRALQAEDGPEHQPALANAHVIAVPICGVSRRSTQHTGTVAVQ